MDRFINPNLLNPQNKPHFIESKLELENQHLLVEAELAKSFFENAVHSYAIYIEDRGVLRMSPYFDTEFKKKHKDCELLFIKTKTKNNDKSISLLHLFADFPLDKSNRSLEFSFTEVENYLEIILK